MINEGRAGHNVRLFLSMGMYVKSLKQILFLRTTRSEEWMFTRNLSDYGQLYWGHRVLQTHLSCSSCEKKNVVSRITVF